jgi:hypothetical protein
MEQESSTDEDRSIDDDEEESDREAGGRAGWKEMMVEHMSDLQSLRVERCQDMRSKWKNERERNIAYYVNQETRRRQAVVTEETKSLPRQVLMARSYSPFGTSLADIGRRFHLKFNHAGKKLTTNTLNGESIPHLPMKELCDGFGCTKVKSHAHLKGSFSKEDYGPGQLIVCDTIGPLSASIGGGKYWMFLKDRRTKYYLTYVVTQKSDIPACVIVGRRRFRTLSVSVARRIQMDGDGAYTSTDLKAKIEEMGTLPSWSSPYDHPQNECAENSVHAHNGTVHAWR